MFYSADLHLNNSEMRLSQHQYQGRHWFTGYWTVPVCVPGAIHTSCSSPHCGTFRVPACFCWPITSQGCSPCRNYTQCLWRLCFSCISSMQKKTRILLFEQQGADNCRCKRRSKWITFSQERRLHESVTAVSCNATTLSVNFNTPFNRTINRSHTPSLPVFNYDQ